MNAFGLDMNKLRHLADTDMDAFEHERARILYEYRKSLPPKTAKMIHAYQMKLELKRLNEGSEAFMVHLYNQAVQNFEDLADQMSALAVALEKNQDYKPHLESLKKGLQSS